MSKNEYRGDVKIVLMTCCGWYPLLFFAAYLHDFDRTYIWNWKLPEMSLWGTRPTIIGMVVVFSLTTAFFTHDVYRNRRLIWQESKARTWHVCDTIALYIYSVSFLVLGYAVYRFEYLYLWQSTPIYFWQSRPFVFCVACISLAYLVHNTYRLCRYLSRSRVPASIGSGTEDICNLQSDTDGVGFD